MSDQNNELTIKDYQDALDVQSACNLCGVVQSFAKVMLKIRASANGTDEANKHPIARLYAEQIAYLSGAGMGDTGTYTAAYVDVHRALEVKVNM